MLYLLLEVYPAPDVHVHLTGKGQRLLDREILKRKQWLDKLGEDHPLYKLVRDCLKDEPDERPSMANISRQLTMTNVFKVHAQKFVIIIILTLYRIKILPVYPLRLLCNVLYMHYRKKLVV